MPWYALHVRSNFESLVRQQLAAAGIEAFYPHAVEKSKDKKRDVERKFMPGYVFSRFELAERTPVIAIPQVVSILGHGRFAAPIPDAEIAAVRLIASQPTAAPCAYNLVAAGDRVRVESGPLTGLEGYVAYAKNTARVIVSVSMLARSISAEVDADSLTVLDRAVAA